MPLNNMPDFPLVSVTTCSYNNSAYIIDTLNSIRDQTYPNIELIIVDDFSTDNSVQLIEDWLKNYNGKYRFIKNEKNLAGGEPYNIALSHATGKYYSVVDTDDVLMPEKITRQVSILEAADKSIGAVYSDAYLIDTKGEPLDGSFIPKHRQFSTVPSGDIYNELLKGNFIPLMSLLIRRDILKEIGGYDESLIYGDFDLWLRIAAKYQFLFSDYVSGKYRIRPGSLTNTIKNWEYSNFRIFEKHIDAPLHMNWLYDMAWKAYLNSDDDSMPLVKTIGSHLRDRILIANYLLWQLGISEEHGSVIITSVHQHIARGLSNLIFNSQDSDVNIFLNEIAHSVSESLLFDIVLKSYRYNNLKTKVLLEALAARKNDPYLLTMLLLWNLGIRFENGEFFLQKILEKRSYFSLQQASKVNELSTSLILNEIAYQLPADILCAALEEAYFNKNEAIKPLFNELTNKAGNILFTAVRLLWKFNISTELGKQILSDVHRNIKNDQSEMVSDINIPDDKLFTKELIPLMSLPQLHSLAVDAYGTGNIEIINIVKEIAENTRDFVLLAAGIFWNLKIPVGQGKELLDTIRNSDAYKTQPALSRKYTFDIEFFINEIQPLIQFDEFKAIAASTYYADSKEFMPIIRNSYSKNANRYLKSVLALWKYKVNSHTGEIILKRIDDYCSQNKNKYYIDLCIYKDIYLAIRTKNVR
jgi:glycosyltransferase involved in cell wall biosynthesis